MNNTQRKHQETSDYFPFVSGELLEEHRKVLNQQMRSEIQQYMTSTQRKTKDGGSKSAMNRDNTERSGWNNNTQRNSCLSQSQTRFLHVQKVTPNVVRSMFDSVYLRPEENPRCINYSDPAKAHIMEDAKKRQEQRKADDVHRNNLIDARIQSDQNRDDEHARQAYNVFRDQQRQTRDTLMEQSAAKVSKLSNC